MTKNKSLSTYFISFLMSKYYVAFMSFMLPIAGSMFGLSVSPWITNKGHIVAGLSFLAIGTILFTLEKKRRKYLSLILDELKTAISKTDSNKN